MARRLLATDRYVDCLLVVESHLGDEIFRVGGRWDKLSGCYVSAAGIVPKRVRLQESQCVNKDGTPGVAYGFARWLEAVRRGEKKRPRLMVAGGNRGSGKTWFLAGVGFVACALEWPGDWQFGVNLTSPQRRECVEAIEEVAAPGWIAFKSDDLRDPFLRFVTGSQVGWASAQNPKRLRQAKLRIRHVLLNEGQDMAERVYINAQGAIRNVGGLVSVATNPPQAGAGDWVATIWTAIEAGEVGHRGEIYHLDSKQNRAVDQDALSDIAVLIGAVSQEAADADAGGQMKLSGPVAYKNFRALPIAKGGHVGDPPPTPMVGKPIWRDITRELTAEKLQGGEGFDWIIGSDFQRRPGIVGVACKLFRVEQDWSDGPRRIGKEGEDLGPLPIGTLVCWAGDAINCPGDESAFAALLEEKGYFPNAALAGGRGQTALLVGDGTGARQNAAHRWELPPSFQAMRADGWSIIPPSKSRKGKPVNPRVSESRAQMWDGFNGRQLLVSPKLKDRDEGFPSLVSALQRAKVNSNGNLVGGYHHGPDAFRYVWFCFGPRPQPPSPGGALDGQTFDGFAAIKVLTSV